MKSTLFCLTCHIEPEGDNFTIFEKEKASLARPVEVVYDINNRKVVLFESEADIETVALKAYSRTCCRSSHKCRPSS